jgi:hypothetical protein
MTNFNRLFRLSAADFFFALVALAIMIACAHAADASAPETVAAATSEGTKVVWAWGDILSKAAATIASLVVAGLAIAARQLPAQFAAIFANSRVQTLIDNAVNYGINAVAGAVKGQTLTVDVGNKVLAEALQYAVDNAPAYLLSWAGGTDGLAKKILGKLDLPAEANADAVPGTVAATTPGA